MPTPYYSGLIVNYNCTAACRHCMFASKPHVSEDCGAKASESYITYEKALEICKKLSASGVTSMHIGGGEPFINFEGLCEAVCAMSECGIGVDYIETNCFWCRDPEIIKRRATRLKSMGVDTIMASLDPFHIEFVPLENVVKFCNVMNEIGMDYFVWQDKFYRRLLPLDTGVTHTVRELEELLGKNYAEQTAREYGLGMNGRALKIAERMYPMQSYNSLKTSEPCEKLLSGRHCHTDFYGNVTPSGCPGMSVELCDYLEAKDGFDREKYPALSRLAEGGVGALADYAETLGINLTGESFPTKCAMCYRLRCELLKTCPSGDLAPLEFYEGMK